MKKGFQIPLFMTIIIYLMIVYVEKIHPIFECYIHHQMVYLMILYFCAIAIVDIHKRKLLELAIFFSIMMFIILYMILFSMFCL